MGKVYWRTGMSPYYVFSFAFYENKTYATLLKLVTNKFTFLISRFFYVWIVCSWNWMVMWDCSRLQRGIVITHRRTESINMPLLSSCKPHGTYISVAICSNNWDRGEERWKEIRKRLWKIQVERLLTSLLAGTASWITSKSDTKKWTSFFPAIRLLYFMKMLSAE